jgi:uncharacterized coiled-coil protein SlyX
MSKVRVGQPMEWLNQMIKTDKGPSQQIVFSQFQSTIGTINVRRIEHMFTQQKPQTQMNLTKKFTQIYPSLLNQQISSTGPPPSLHTWFQKKKCETAKEKLAAVNSVKWI